MKGWEKNLILLNLYAEKMVWFRIQSKDGKKVIIRNPEGLDTAIKKGK